MEKIVRGLQLDLQTTCQAIEDLIRTSMNNLDRDGATIGLSGGLDSAVAATLTVRSLGTDRVHLLNMPDRDSKPIHRDHARRLAAHLDAPLKVKPVTPMLRAAGTYRLLPLRFVPNRKLRTRLVAFGKSKLLSGGKEQLLTNRFQYEAGSWVAKGVAYAIAKHRARLVTIYQHAEIHNLLVVGAANRTEWLTGTFSKWGLITARM